MSDNPKKALIVVDMVKGFVWPKTSAGPCPLYIEGAAGLIPVIKALIDKLDPEDQLIFVMDTHDPEDKEFRTWPKHCIVGSEEAEVVPELLDTTHKHREVRKTRYSAFYSTSLESLLNYHGVEDVIICGVATEYCIFATALDATYRDYKVTIPYNAVKELDIEKATLILDYLKKSCGVKLG